MFNRKLKREVEELKEIIRRGIDPNCDHPNKYIGKEEYLEFICHEFESYSMRSYCGICGKTVKLKENSYEAPTSAK